MCSPCPHLGFPRDPWLPGCRQPSHLSPQLFLLHTKSLEHPSLSPVLTVPDPSPDYNSLKLSLLFSQSSEVKCTGGREFKASLY